MRLLLALPLTFAFGALDLWAAIPIGLVLGLSPVLSGVAAAAGGLLGAALVTIAGERLQRWLYSLQWFSKRRARGTLLEPLRSDRRGLPIPRICRDAYKHARSSWPWGPAEKAAVLDKYEFSVLGRRPHRSRGSRLLYIRELPSF
jgi:hypothetical protein